MMDKQQAITWLEQIKVKYIHGGDEQFDDCRRESIDMAIQALRQPQIVRCKDCKNIIKKDVYKDNRIGNPMEEAYICFSRFVVGRLVDPDFFCAYGKPKDGDGE